MEILRSKKVKTRKRHLCNACEREFPVGTSMVATVTVQDGIYTWRTCETCTELLEKYRSEFEDIDGYYEQGCVREALWEDMTPELLLNHLEKQNTNKV